MFMGESSSGNNVDPLEMLEAGICKNVIAEKCIKPLERKESWQQCFILSEGKHCFKMYDESSGALLLTAKRTKGGEFYISQYEDFPETFKGPVKNGENSNNGPSCDIRDSYPSKQIERYCVVLKPGSTKSSFKLVSRSCELCDKRLNKFSCGASSGQCNGDRQILGIITHRTTIIDQTDIEARCLDVQLPGLLNGERIVWCPRTMAKGVHADITLENQRLRSYSTGDSKYGQEQEESKEGEESDGDERPKNSEDYKAKRGKQLKQKNIPFTKNANGDRYYFTTKLPKWNDEVGSLVLQFRNKRVRMASSKNFILTDKNDPQKLVFQLGKCQSGRFNLDFKNPMSPLQAFGIALSAYGFNSKK